MDTVKIDTLRPNESRISMRLRAFLGSCLSSGQGHQDEDDRKESQSHDAHLGAGPNENGPQSCCKHNAVKGQDST